MDADLEGPGGVRKIDKGAKARLILAELREAMAAEGVKIEEIYVGPREVTLRAEAVAESQAAGIDLRGGLACGLQLLHELERGLRQPEHRIQLHAKAVVPQQGLVALAVVVVNGERSGFGRRRLHDERW